MLYHLIPKIFSPQYLFQCGLISVDIADFGLALDAGNALTARRPYPNKNYLVACRKVGKLAKIGILIEAPPVEQFTVTTKWLVTPTSEAVTRIEEASAITHEVHYTVLDDKYDAITESSMLWGGSSEPEHWENRVPDEYAGRAPMDIVPRMIIDPRQITERQTTQAEYTMTDGIVAHLSEKLRMPTVQPERIFNRPGEMSKRMPSRGEAFVASHMHADVQSS